MIPVDDVGLKVVMDPPIVVEVVVDAVVLLPGGGRVYLPAGAEIQACGKVPLEYDVDGRVMRIKEPCPEPPLFRDSFEE